MSKNKPCIQCGQLPGPPYEGPPHDHICGDCGQEWPVKSPDDKDAK